MQTGWRRSRSLGWHNKPCTAKPPIYPPQLAHDTPAYWERFTQPERPVVISLLTLLTASVPIQNHRLSSCPCCRTPPMSWRVFMWIGKKRSHKAHLVDHGGAHDGRSGGVGGVPAGGFTTMIPSTSSASTVDWWVVKDLNLRPKDYECVLLDLCFYLFLVVFLCLNSPIFRGGSKWHTRKFWQ